MNDRQASRQCHTAYRCQDESICMVNASAHDNTDIMFQEVGLQRGSVNQPANLDKSSILHISFVSRDNERDTATTFGKC